MPRLTAGLGAFLFCGSLGIWPGQALTHQDVTATNNPVETAAAGSKPPWHVGDMDEDEKERRRQVCDREYDDCYDWCNRSKGGSKCKTECDRK